MIQLNTKNGLVKIFAKTLEEEALKQITQLADSVLGQNANIRIMPDAHAGAGCVIGTTMVVTDKVCPNLVGVDIGCGVDLVKTNIDFKNRLKELDGLIRKFIPFGKNRHSKVQSFRDFINLKCWDALKNETRETALKSLGTLGGGNHFIEAYDNGYLAVHSGSRNIGYMVADFYQNLAFKQMQKLISDQPFNFKNEEENKETAKSDWTKTEKSLSFLTGEKMQDYLHDMGIMQEFARQNRAQMLKVIVEKMGGEILSQTSSTHNYIDMSGKQIILRKGAVAAQKGQQLVVPLNMRDGLLVCAGKGNPDWNYSSPHGAGRLYSRTKARQILNMDEYKDSMKGIFSSCINRDTLDEAPFAYKDYKEIVKLVEPTVDIIDRLIPIFNFKAGE